MASLAARQLALEVCSGVIPANCPPPSEEEQRQLMAVMAEYEWLAQQQLQLYAFGNESIMDIIEIQSECQMQQPPCVAAGNDVISNETLMSLMEMQSESQTRHQPYVIAGMHANTNVQDHTGDYQEVNRLLEQLQVLNREPQPLSPPLQSLFQAIQLLDEQAQPVFADVEHEQSNTQQRSLPVASARIPQLNQQTSNSDFTEGSSSLQTRDSRSQNGSIPPRRMEVPAAPNQPSPPEQLYPRSSIAGPEATMRSSPIRRRNEREGQVPSTLPPVESSQSRRRRRMRRRNRQRRPPELSDSTFATRGTTTATQPLTRPAVQQMSQAFVRHSSLPTAAMAA